MATITPFHSPVESPVVSMADTYVPIPFQEMAAAGAARQARIEDTLTMEDTLQDQLSQVRGVDEINLPGMQDSIFLGEQNKAQGIVAEYKQAISDLGDEVSDAASPQRRAKIRSLLTKFKHDLSPAGRLGQIQANLEQVKQFNERVSESPDLANNPHLITPYLQRVQQYAMQHADGSVGNLNLNLPMGEKVDRNAKLVANLKLMGSQVLGESEVQKYGDNIAGLYAAIQETGIDEKRIAETAAQLMMSDPEMERDIMNQVQYERANGRNTTPQEIMMQNIAPMVGIFKTNKRDIKTFEDKAAVKKAARQAELRNMYSRPVVMPKSGSGFQNVSELVKGKTMAAEAVKTATDAYQLWAKSVEESEKVSFPRDVNGNITSFKVMNPNTGRFTDYSEVANVKRKAIRDAQDKEISIEAFDQRLRYQTGYTDAYRNTPEYKEKFQAAMREADLKLRKQAGLERSQGGTGEYDHAAIVDMAESIMSKTDKRAQAYQDALKKSNEEGSFVAGVTRVSEEQEEILTDDFIKHFHSSNEATGSIIDVDTGEELETDEYKGAITKESQPEFVGFYLDDEALGRPKLLFNLKDEEGKFVQRVKIDPPEGFIDNLILDGQVDAAKTVFKQQLYSEIGAGGKVSPSQTLDVGTKNTPYNVNIRNGRATASGRHEIKFTAVDPKTKQETDIVRSFDDMEQAINYLAALKSAVVLKEDVTKIK